MAAPLFRKQKAPRYTFETKTLKPPLGVRFQVILTILFWFRNNTGKILLAYVKCCRNPEPAVHFP